jgi:hypothetical protein
MKKGGILTTRERLPRGYGPRRLARVHNGRINLYAIIPFEDLFMDRAGHVWSTARAGLRQRSFFKYKGLLGIRVSWRGQSANWLVASLTMLARGHNWKVHWDGTQIRPDWIIDEAESITGDGPTPTGENVPKAVDTAPRIV